MEPSQEQSDTPRSPAPAAASSTAPSSPSLSSSRPPRHVGESAATTGETAVPTQGATLEQPPPASTPEDLARQLAGFTVAAQPPPPIAAPQSRRLEPHTQVQEQQEEEWLLKEIHWPPLPPTPAAASPPPPTTSLGKEVRGSAVTIASSEPGFSTDPALKVKIICQNENGPCSLIALCNILILRNDLHIPSGRESVTYSYLSNLLADYFLSLPTTTTAAPPMSLSSVLSILPQTRYGLNLNPRFDRVDGFSSSSAATTETETAGELALFALARIPLLHGWLADPSYSSETHQALLECGDYDAAMEVIVQGAEIAGGVEKLRIDGVVAVGEHEHEEAEEEEMLREVERRSQWTPEQEAKVRKAHLLQSFLESTSTQLTYPGLASLCQSPSLLPPAGLAALFGNSHLSVLFRRPLLPPQPPPPPPPPPPRPSSTTAVADQSQSSSSAAPARVVNNPQAAGGPELFTLVTDSSLVHEGDLVWESLGDVDGGGSEFLDARLRRARVNGGDWVGHNNNNNKEIGSDTRRGSRRPEETGSRGSEAVGAGFEEDEYAGNDLALAQQLQAEEDAYTSAQLQHAQQQQQRQHDPSPSTSGRSRSDGAAPRPIAGGGGGGGVTQTLNADLRAREAEHRRLAAATGKGKKKGSKGGGGKDDKCLVM